MFYRKSLNDVPSFRMLIAVHDEKHPDEVDHYLAFYQAIEAIKSEHNKTNRRLKKAFKNNHQRLMKVDFPYDTPVKDIIISIGNGTLAQQALKPKRAPTTSSQGTYSNPTHYSFAKERVGLVFNILFITTAFVSVILLKPEASFVVLFVLALVTAIMSRCGYGHLATGRSPYKPLIIILGALSFIPFIVVISILLSSKANAVNDITKTQAFVFFIVGLVAAFIYFLLTIIRKTKPSSNDMDNSNVFAYYLLKFMTLTASITGGFFASLSIHESGTIFGMTLDTSNVFVKFFVTAGYLYLSPVLFVLSNLILRLIRGRGL